ncbi:hypothetical protein AGMMS4952_22250 [Spirochaetia bacterium]|nr:hypothetical protein AGMMS4952_22250 [Spirochaetia bacterium]
MSAQDVQDLVKRARMFIRDEKFTEALDTLKETLEKDAECTAAHNLMGVAWGRLGNGKKALAAFRKGKAQEKENPVIHFNLAIALETTDQADKAVPRYRAAFRLHPGWLDAMNALGLVLFKQEDYAGANRIFTKVLKFDPANAEALNNKGLVLADQGRHKEAIKKYRAALEIDRKYVNAGLNLSRALEDMENFTASLEELERLADLVPADWEVRTRLAALYHKLERYDEAMDQARAILEKEGDNIRALRIEGAIHLIQGNDEEAKAIFERITALDSTGGSGESGDTFGRFMMEEPESRYWLDLVPPPAAQLPSVPKPASTHPGAIALAKARAAKKAALAGETPEPEPAEEAAEPETEIVLMTEAPVAGLETEPPEGGLLGLMRYLMNLTETLPEPVLDEFIHSDERMEMKYIIDTLEKADG